MTMRASLIITAKDQASSQFAKIAASARTMSASFRPVTADAHAADRAIHGVGRAASASASRVTRWAGNVRRAARDMHIGERAAIGLAKAVGHAAGITAGLTIRMGQAALGMAASAVKWGALAAAGGAGWMVAGVIKTASTFEQFQAQLEGTEGSAEKAKQALSWVAKFAAQTPYQLEEVTDAFVRARGVGIDPLTGAMTQMGDAAAANRKTIMDAVEAVADAQTGEFERLKSFNITTSVKGNTVAFSYIDKAGKNAVRTTKKTAKDIQKAVLSIWDERHGGAMIRQSKTLAGIWSNLQDWVVGFQARIAGKGIFDRIKNSLADLLDYANRLADDGTLDRWATRISDALETAWNWGEKLVTETNWKQLAKDVWGIAKAAWSVAIAFRNAVNWWREFSISRDIQMQQGIADGWLTSDADKARARQRVNELKAELAALRGDPAPAPPVKAPLKPGRQAVAPWKPAPDTASPWTRSSRLAAPAAPGKAPLKTGAKPVAWPTARTAPAKPVARPARTAASDVKVGGRVEVSIDVKAPAGTQARTTRVASSNPAVPVSAKVGRSMSEAA